MQPDAAPDFAVTRHKNLRLHRETGELKRYPTEMPITSAYHPDVFAMKSLADLDASDFARHPIWSEYYDYTERQDILDWGVPPSVLDGLLAVHHTGNVHAVYTVLKPFPLPDRMRLYIRAKFTTEDGDAFDGYVVNDDAYYYSIFTRGQEFSFGRNGNLDEFDRQSLDALRASLDNPAFQLLPLKFNTDILDDSGNRIGGTIVDGGEPSHATERRWRRFTSGGSTPAAR